MCLSNRSLLIASAFWLKLETGRWDIREEVEVWRSNVKMYIWHFPSSLQTDDRLQHVWTVCSGSYSTTYDSPSTAKPCQIFPGTRTYLYIIFWAHSLARTHTRSHTFAFKSVTCFMCCLPLTLLLHRMQSNKSFQRTIFALIKRFSLFVTE